MTNYYRGSKAPVKTERVGPAKRAGNYRGVQHEGQENERREMAHGLYRGVKWQ